MPSPNGPQAPDVSLTYAKLPNGRLWHIVRAGAVRARCGAPQDIEDPRWHSRKTTKPALRTICALCRRRQLREEYRTGTLWSRREQRRRWGLP